MLAWRQSGWESYLKKPVTTCHKGRLQVLLCRMGKKCLMCKNVQCTNSNGILKLLGQLFGLGRDSKNCQPRNMIWLIRVLVHQAVTLPRDVVIGVHDRKDRVPDEDQQK